MDGQALSVRVNANVNHLILMEPYFQPFVVNTAGSYPVDVVAIANAILPFRVTK